MVRKSQLRATRITGDRELLCFLLRDQEIESESGVRIHINEMGDKWKKGAN